MQFRSFADLNRTVLLNLQHLPLDVDVVVGIPRSGLLPASIIALALNLPLASVDGFASGQLLASGKTKWCEALAVSASQCRKVLLVDDSSLTGIAMGAAREKLRHARPDVEVTTVAVFGVFGVNRNVDIVLERVGEPRVFEWNVMHHKGALARACVDIDGILCRDPTEQENDDGEAYLRFLANTTPLHRPTGTIHALVTSRLEKYRKETESWLARHGVSYERLIMLDLPDAETRRAMGAHGAFKAQYYASNRNAVLFIESERSQAETIAATSKKPVLWLPGATMVYHDGVAPADTRALARAADPYARRVKRLVRGLVGAAAYERLKHALRPGITATAR